MNMQAKSKWSCIKCDVPIPYNPQFTVANTMCSNCAAYYNADRLLVGYEEEIICSGGRILAFINPLVILYARKQDHKSVLSI